MSQKQIKQQRTGMKVKINKAMTLLRKEIFISIINYINEMEKEKKSQTEILQGLKNTFIKQVELDINYLKEENNGNAG